MSPGLWSTPPPPPSQAPAFAVSAPCWMVNPQGGLAASSRKQGVSPSPSQKKLIITQVFLNEDLTCFQFLPRRACVVNKLERTHVHSRNGRADRLPFPRTILGRHPVLLVSSASLGRVRLYSEREKEQARTGVQERGPECSPLCFKN